MKKRVVTAPRFERAPLDVNRQVFLDRLAHGAERGTAIRDECEQQNGVASIDNPAAEQIPADELPLPRLITGLKGNYDPQNGIAQVVRGEMKGVAIIFQDHDVIHLGSIDWRLFDFRVSSLSKV